MCAYNPDVSSRLLPFLRDNATDGGQIMTMREYEMRVVGLGLPSAQALVRQVGSWDVVAALAGLEESRRTPTRSRLDGPTESIGPDPERDYAEGLNARPGVLVVGVWEPKLKRYVPGRMETGWCRLW